MTELHSQNASVLATWEQVASYDSYEFAQQAVDYLSDQKFPVQYTSIVGSDLKSVERVTGRLTWGRVILSGIGSGLMIGLWIGLLFAIFLGDGTGAGWGFILNAMWFGAILGVVLATIGYAFQRGRRDFSSVSRVVAMRYDILADPAHAAQARTLLGSGA